jgi:starch synthase
VLGLEGNLFTADGLEFYGQINFLKGGVLFADVVTTVSPTYARKIRSPGHGFDLEGLFQRCRHLTGILNGVDYSVWNPTTDHFLAGSYTRRIFRANTPVRPMCKGFSR